MKKGNLVLAALCGVLGVAILVITAGYPKAAQYGTGAPGPGLWPACIAVILLVCTAILLFRTMKTSPAEAEPVAIWTEGSRRVYISMGILFVYVFVLPILGFILSTTAMQFIFIQWFAKKKPYITLAISAAITLVVYFAFKLLLNVPIHFGLFAL